MTVQDPTTNYGWDLPLDGGSTDTWGTELNEAIGEALGAAIESVDTVIDALATAIALAITNKEELDERVERLESVAPRPAYGRVHLVSTVQLAKASAEDIVWDTEDFDLGGVVDLATQPTRLTIPSNRDGLFTIRGQVTLPYTSGSGDDGASFLLRIMKNGATEIAVARKHYMNDDVHEDRSGDITISIEALDDAVETDYYELEITYDYNDTGVATKQISQGVMRSFFELYRHWSPLVALDPVVGDTATTWNASTTQHSINIPTHEVGQILVVSFCTRGALPHTIFTAGWTQVMWLDNLVTTNSVYTKIATGSDALTIECSPARTGAAVAYAFADAHGDVESVIVDISNQNPPPITPTWGAEKTFYIAVLFAGSAPITVTAPPTNYGAVIEVDNGGGTDAGMVVASRVAAVTTEDPDAFNTSGAGADSMGIIAVRGAELT